MQPQLSLLVDPWCGDVVIPTLFSVILLLCCLGTLHKDVDGTAVVRKVKAGVAQDPGCGWYCGGEEGGGRRGAGPRTALRTRKTSPALPYKEAGLLGADRGICGGVISVLFSPSF
ncbi:hypothetical protein J6590_066156 [Homalodisca vitripennis]|nr:hypothetical protein J6590_066156 [Homalodisca vitripennis]